MNIKIEICHCYVSAGHNFVGHHGQAPGRHPVITVPQLECIAGRGIRGDRFFDHADNFKGQITFFAEEVYEELCVQLGIRDKAPGAFRRNVITRGTDLNALVGLEFEIQGLRFFGTEECRPCHWMEQAFGPGAEAAMRGRGGLRARILSSGILRRDARSRQLALFEAAALHP